MIVKRFLQHYGRMGSGGWNPTISWAQLKKGGGHPSPMIRKRYPFTAGLTEFSGRWMAKPSLELTTFRRLSAPELIRSDHSTTLPLSLYCLRPLSTPMGVDYVVIGFDMEVQPLVTHNAA